MKLNSFYFLFLFLINISFLYSQISKQWVKREFKHIIIEEKLWIGTPNGLYQYHPDEDTWTVYGTHTGLPANDIKQILWDGEFLIVATSKGVAFGDINLNKWLNYNTENGLPSNNVLSLAYQEDYIWIGTDKGAARYDKLIQEWESFSTKDGLADSIVYDIITENELVYFATANGLTEYDPNFEKWRYYKQKDGIASDTIYFMYETSEYLWLFTKLGPTRFNKKLHSTLSFTENQNLSYSNIYEFVTDGDQFWVSTPAGLLIYDQAANIWRHFQEEMSLPHPLVNGMFFSQESRWFVTQKGIAEFNESTKTWQQYDQTHGLSSDNYKTVILAFGKVFLLNNNTIDYYETSENRWTIFPIRDISKIDIKDKTLFSLDKEKGSYIQFNPDIKFSISGSRFNYRFQNSLEYNTDTDQQTDLYESSYRADMKAQLFLSKGRTVNAFYDNTDISQVIYGLRYKGIKGDIVQEANWGDIRNESGKSRLMPSLGAFGVSTLLETGKKTKRYKRSLFTARGFSGEQTTDREKEFFTGNIENSEITIRDIDYIKSSFFRIDTSGIFFPVQNGTEKIYVDDNILATNNANTLDNFSIAGIIGDFDQLQPYIDYAIEDEHGIIRFLKPISTTSTIVVTGISKGIPFERVIKNADGINQLLVNRYFIGGMDIIPYTFELEIFDNQDNKYPLPEFGLDANNDGFVDPDWIDYQQGILEFPDLYPFPSSTYDLTNPISNYTFNIRFKTEITIFNLRNNNLIRGSEIVTVDGEVLTPGEDYVLDYTSGTLLILKEGIVAEDSETEVFYEYYLDTNEQFHNAGISFGPSDNALININYISFEKKQLDSTIVSTNGINIFSELKFQVEEVDFKFTPELSRSLAGNIEGNAFIIRSDVSSQKIRLFSEFEKYDKNFNSLISTKFKLGEIQNRISVGGTYYPTNFLDINSNWKKTRSQIQSNGRENLEEELNGRILFSRNRYPALSLSTRHLTLKDEIYNTDKESIKGELDYDLSQNLLDYLTLNSLSVYAVFRRSWEDIDTIEKMSLIPGSKKIHDNQYIRLDFSPANLIQISSYYRGKSTLSKDNTTGNKQQLQNKQHKIFFNATADRIKGVNLSLRYQAEISEHFLPLQSTLRNVYLYRNLQSNVRFFPGRWINFFSPITFEISYQPTWRGSLKNISHNLSWQEKYISINNPENTISSEDNKLYQFRTEWRPSSIFYINSNQEFYKIKSKYLDSRLITNVYKSNYKIEYRPLVNSIITIQLNHKNEDKKDYSNRIQTNPFLWIENRWTENLQTRINVSYFYNEYTIGKIKENSSTFTPSIGFIYRFFKSDSKRLKMELRDNISFTSYRDNISTSSLDYNSLTHSIAFDYYPFSVLLSRLRINTIYKHILETNQDIYNNTAELILTLQF
jgi:hypothetical protein